MKFKTLVLIWLAVAVSLLVCYEARFVLAATDTGKSGLKIGVVDVQKIFKDSKKVGKYREETMAERGKVEADLDKLAKEIDAEKAGLKTLKSGTTDYMSQVKEILTKQANSQAQEKFYEQQMSMKEQSMVESIYTEILQHVKKVAEEKGLDLVLDKDEINFPALSLNDATMVIRTHKILYSSGSCPDITSDVIAAMDKESK